MSHLDELSTELTELATGAAKWVVRVNGRRGPNATGILWSDSTIITSHRAAHRDSEIEIGMPDGSLVTAKVQGRAPDMDFAVLSLDEPFEMAAPPWSEEARPGLTMALARDKQGRLLTQLALIPGEELVHRMAPVPEFLGSPLVDRGGHFLGMHLLVGRPTVVSHRELKSMFERLAAGENLEAGFLGLGLHQVEHEGGFACLAVKVEGPAQEAGLKVGDIVLALDGVEVNDPESVRNTLRSLSAGTKVPITFSRGGNKMECSAQLGRRPEPHFPAQMKRHIRKVIKHFKHHHHHHHGHRHRHRGPGPEIC